MSDQTSPQTPPTEISDCVQTACAIATGGPSDPNAAELSIRAAHKDLNGKGRGPWWYRMVYRAGAWTYFSNERLPMGTFLASDRRATVRGDVFVGELVCSHDKSGPVDALYLVVGGEDKILAVEWKKRRDGQLTITLPNGQEVVRPNPRSR